MDPEPLGRLVLHRLKEAVLGRSDRGLVVARRHLDLFGGHVGDAVVEVVLVIVPTTEGLGLHIVVVAREAGATLAREHRVRHVGIVDGLAQVVRSLVGLGMARDAVREGLLGGIAEEDQAMVGGQTHDGALKRVARGAAAVLGVQVRDVERAIVGRHRLHGEPIAVGVAKRLVGLGVGGVLLAVLIEAGQGGHAVHKTALCGEPADTGQLIAVAVTCRRSRLGCCRGIGRLVGPIARRGSRSAAPGQTSRSQNAREHRRARNPLARAPPRSRCLLSHISSLGFGK